MDQSIFGNFLKCNETEMLDGIESGCTAPFATMVKKPSTGTKREPDEEVPGQSERLRRLMKAYDYETSTAIAAYLDISVQRWNACLNGEPLSRQLAFLLVRKFTGISLDWLYFGKTEALPVGLARRLGEFDPPPAVKRSN